MKKQNLRKRPARIRKENLLKLIEGVFMHFDDGDTATVEEFPGYVRMLLGQDSKRIMSFLEKRKVIKIIESKSTSFNSGHVGTRKDALVDRAKLTALKKEVESCLGKFFQYGEMLVWGKGKKERRSRLL